MGLSLWSLCLFRACPLHPLQVGLRMTLGIMMANAFPELPASLQTGGSDQSLLFSLNAHKGFHLHPWWKIAHASGKLALLARRRSNILIGLTLSSYFGPYFMWVFVKLPCWDFGTGVCAPKMCGPLKKTSYEWWGCNQGIDVLSGSSQKTFTRAE